MTSNNQRLNNVIESLEKVNPEIKQMVYQMALEMSEMEIIQSFNQRASDLFTLLIVITKRLGRESEFKINGYKNLFDSATRINKKLPLDKFTLIILEYAAEIYTEEENCFLNMTIPDANVTVGNEFGIIRSAMFKKLWTDINPNNKNNIKEVVIPLTTFAHAHLYKTVLLQNQNS